MGDKESIQCIDCTAMKSGVEWNQGLDTISPNAGLDSIQVKTVYRLHFTEALRWTRAGALSGQHFPAVSWWLFQMGLFVAPLTNEVEDGRKGAVL